MREDVSREYNSELAGARTEVRIHRLLSSLILLTATFICSGPGAHVLFAQQGSKLFSSDAIDSANQRNSVALSRNGTMTQMGGSGYNNSGTAQLNGIFEIFNAQTGKVLEVAAASTSDGALVQQNALNGNAEQQWQFVAIGDGSYAIMNAHSSFVMDVIGASTTDGTLVQQYQSVGRANQHWVLTLVDDVHYSIVNVNSGKALDIPLGNAANNTPVHSGIIWATSSNCGSCCRIPPITSSMM